MSTYWRTKQEEAAFATFPLYDAVFIIICYQLYKHIYIYNMILHLPLPLVHQLINSLPAEINEVIYFLVVELNFTYILDIMWFARDYRLNCGRFELRSSF